MLSARQWRYSDEYVGTEPRNKYLETIKMEMFRTHSRFGVPSLCWCKLSLTGSRMRADISTTAAVPWFFSLVLRAIAMRPSLVMLSATSWLPATSCTSVVASCEDLCIALERLFKAAARLAFLSM